MRWCTNPALITRRPTQRLLPKKSKGKEPEFINEYIPTLDMQNIENIYKTPVMFLSQNSVITLTGAEIIEAKS